MSSGRFPSQAGLISPSPCACGVAASAPVTRVEFLAMFWMASRCYSRREIVLSLLRRGGWIGRLALVVVVAAFALACMAVPAYADSGTVYGCTVHPSYRHPVTGAIEDSGGRSAEATGQAMVESCMYSSGMMEVTDSGACYLTVRLGLMDFTSGHDFRVQDRGASKWSVPALGVTATGSDSKGTTSDVCIELPSTQSILRVSMYVDTMGRNVVFYAYADGFVQGVPDGFTPTIVTQASAASEVAPAEPLPEADDASNTAPTVAADEAVATSAEGAEVSDASSVGELASGTASGASAGSQESGDASGLASPSTTTEGEVDAVEGADDLTEDSVGSSAQGLSLSTAPETLEVDGEAEGTDGVSSIKVNSLSIVVELAIAVLVVGIVLMGIAACIVYVFRRNWNRWAGYDPDDYGAEYRDE